MTDEIQPDRPKKKRPKEDDELDQEPAPRKRRASSEDEDDPDRFRTDGTGGLIPYRNPKALISYYCGVFSLIPCVGGILGPIALILGFLGIGYQKKHPTAGGMAHAIIGIVLGGLTTLAHLGLLVAGVLGGVLSSMK